MHSHLASASLYGTFVSITVIPFPIYAAWTKAGTATAGIIRFNLDSAQAQLDMLYY